MGGAKKPIVWIFDASCSFNRRGDSLGGATGFEFCPVAFCKCFNRRGDSLGGEIEKQLLKLLSYVKLKDRRVFFWGYKQTDVVCSWIGFDQPRTLGKGESGGSAALPTWIGYMAVALKDVPQTFMSQPDGLVALEIENPGKGPAREFFYKENVPPVIEIEPPQDPDDVPID